MRGLRCHDRASRPLGTLRDRAGATGPQINQSRNRSRSGLECAAVLATRHNQKSGLCGDQPAEPLAVVLGTKRVHGRFEAFNRMQDYVVGYRVRQAEPTRIAKALAGHGKDPVSLQEGHERHVIIDG